jgi:hypothetical protein
VVAAASLLSGEGDCSLPGGSWASHKVIDEILVRNMGMSLLSPWGTR